MRWRFLKAVAVAALALGAHGVQAQTGTSLDAMVQPPALGAPQRGSLAGSLSAVAFGPADLSRGGFSLPVPVQVPQERGPLLAPVLPAYAMDSGLSEWGAGWHANLALTRWRERGELDYATDELTGPWGRLVRGTDGSWYPLGLASPVRLEEDGERRVAHLADGSRWTFGGEQRVSNARGTYAWLLTDVETVLGERTRLTWERNTSGRPFLAAVHYGGRGEDFQYRLELTYEPVARPFVDYRSGTGLALDRRVKQVVVLARNAQTGAFAERWRHTLEYAAEPGSPGFRLAQVQQTFASGAQPPPVRYQYASAEQWLSGTQLQPVPAVSELLSRTRSDLLRPDRSTLLDANADGRLDVESAVDNTLYVQTDAGFLAQPLPPRPADAPLECRRSPSAYNTPRTLAQLRADEAEHRVVSLVRNSAQTQTALTVCSREGARLATQTLAGNWQLSSTVRLVDVDRDFQPDLVRVTPGAYAVLPNTSSAAGPAFGAVRTGVLRPSLVTDTLWVHDVNGDTVPDLVARAGGGLTVWWGKGDFGFEPDGKALRFTNAQGQTLPNLQGQHLTFTDANRDGLADALLYTSTTGRTALYLNTGDGFVAQAVPALAALGAGTSAPLAADVAGSGDSQVFFQVGGAARTLALDGAHTGLLREADDGKGTRLTFTYARGPAAPGAYERPAVLQQLQVRSTGRDTVRYGYSYLSPRAHGAGRFLLGFDRVSRQAPLATHTLEFLNEDRYAGLPLYSRTQDALSPAVEAFESWDYAPALLQGVPWMRLRTKVAGFSGAAQGRTLNLSEQVEYLEYAQGLCPSRVRTTTPHGVLVTETAYAQPTRFTGHLSCLEAQTTRTGTHADASLDFRYGSRVQRNALGQVERTESLASEGTLVTQEVSYDEAHRVASIGSPGRGTVHFDYQPGTQQLVRVTAPDGVVREVTARDAVTDALLTLQTRRGPLSTRAHSRFDGEERLVSQWDDLGAATELNPTVRYAYRYATDTHLASLYRSSLVDATQGIAEDVVELADAAGESLTAARRVPGGWAFGPLTTRSLETGTRRVLLRSPLAATEDPAALTHAQLVAGAQELERQVDSGLGHAVEARALFHADVEQLAASALSMGDGHLVLTHTEDAGGSTRALLDASRRTLLFTDEAGAEYAYTYDASGQLASVLLPSGTRHRVVRDGHGRVKRVERQALAAVEYHYAPTTGFLARKDFLSPTGQVVRSVSWVYDAVGRAREERHQDALTQELRVFRYYYDGATPQQPDARHAPGLLTAVTGDGYLKLFEYRADGLLTRRSVLFPGWRRVDTQLRYLEGGTLGEQEVRVHDAAGRLLSSSRRTFLFDEAGRAAGFQLNGLPFVTYGYNARDQLESAGLPGGARAAIQYDATTRRFTGSSILGPQVPSTPPGNESLARLPVPEEEPLPLVRRSSSVSVRMNARGLVDEEQLTVNGQPLNRHYTYSDQKFLESAEDEQSSYSYSYDLSGMPTRTQSVSGTRKVSSTPGSLDAQSTLYRLDELGRVVQKGDLELLYGPDGHASTIRRGTSEWRFVYDENGQRLLKSRGDVPLTAYLPEGMLDESGLSEPVYFAARPLGLLKNGHFELVHTDYRGTVMADLNGASTLASPFGERSVRPSISSALDFMEKGFDADIGLVRMGVRDYDPELSVFLSPDPLLLEQPQQCVDTPLLCNLYAYAYNNPLLYADPLGTKPSKNAAHSTSAPLPAGAAGSGGSLPTGGTSSGKKWGGSSSSSSTPAPSAPSTAPSGGPSYTFGIGIERPPPAAITRSNALDLDVDTGHTFAYWRDSTGTVTEVLSFGPGAPVGPSNQKDFARGKLPGNARWHLAGMAVTHEWKISAADYKAGVSFSTALKAKGGAGVYSPDRNCTSVAIEAGKASNVVLPDGVGPVLVDLPVIGKTEKDYPNPHALDDQLKSRGGTTVPTSVFPSP